MSAVYVGVDWGGTYIKLLIADEELIVAAARKIPTNKTRPIGEVAGEVAGEIEQMLAEAGIPKSAIAGIGLGLPGLVDKNGHALLLPSFGPQSLEIDDIGKLLERYFYAPVISDNDANIAVLGEKAFGAAKNKKDVVVLTLGTGIGGGVLVGGQLLRGRDGYAAELGHLILSDRYDEEPNGEKNSFEALCSATGMLQHAQDLMQQNRMSVLWELAAGNSLNLPLVAEGYDRGDDLCAAVLGRAAKYLGRAVCNMIYLFNPELVVIGGGVSLLGERLLAPLQKYVNDHLFHPVLNCDIVVSPLGGDAGALGAVVLAQYHGNMLVRNAPASRPESEPRTHNLLADFAY